MSIETRNLTRIYGRGGGRHRALSGVDLAVDRGEFVAVVGTSGSGKTTLLNIVGGLDRQYEGEVRVDGRRLAELSERRLAELRNRTFGFVFQQFHLLDHLTARENVELPGFFSPEETRDASGEPDALLERVGLAAVSDTRPPQLSGGQRQRVAIARALYGGPDYLLCDEPTGSLDRATGLQILELFRNLNREEDLTLIVVTHEEHIARMARRIVRLEDGDIVSDEPNDPVEPGEAEIVGTRGAAPGPDEEAP